MSAKGQTNSIEAEGLVREYKKGPRAVDGIDLRVDPGEIYGFLGPNGAGKSTTVHMLTTLLPPSGGRATSPASTSCARARPSARRSARRSRRRRSTRSSPAASTCASRPRSTGSAGKARRAAGDELLERVGLTDAADRKVGGYSGGMKRRLDLALALVHRPRILFLDEPTTGPRPAEPQRASGTRSARLAQEDGVTVFLTTQYLEEADVLADRVGIIDRGRIVAEGTPARLKAEIGRPSVEVVPADPAELAAAAATLERFGERHAEPAERGRRPPRAAPATLARVVRALDAEGIALAHLELHEPTLDDVFLAKTGRSLEGAGDADREPEPEPQPDPVAA